MFSAKVSHNHMFHILNFKTKIPIFVALLLILLFVFKQAIAGHATELYEVEILLVNKSASVRRDAFKQGLDEVFIRISGDSIIMSKLKRPAPATYVKQYSYEPIEQPETNLQGELLTHRIKIQYNSSLMEKYLQQNGFPVWGEHRPEVVVWLVVRDGRNQYVLKQSDSSLIKAATDKALIRRGVPVHWPLYDSKDKKILSVADIRGGFKDPVTAASKRYSRGPALTGSMIWNGKQWQSSWSLLMPSEGQHGENRHWNMTEIDHKRLINKAIDRVADALGIVFAIRGSTSKRQLKTIHLNIQDVNSIRKYRKLENYLRNISTVEMATPLKVDGQNANFAVTLRSNEEDFLNLIENDAELIKARPIKPQYDVQVLPEDNQSATKDVATGFEKTPDVVANTAAATATTESSETSSLLPQRPGGQLDGQLDEQPDKKSPPLPVYHYKLIK